MLSPMSFKLYSFFSYFFSFQLPLFSLLLSSRSLVHFSISSSLLLIPSSVLFTSVVFFSSGWFFIHFLSLCWNSHGVHKFLSQVFWPYLWPLSWTFYWVDQNISILFSPFSEVLSWSFIWNVFLCLLILPSSLCLRQVKSFSRVWLFVTPWTVAYRLLHPWDFPGNSTGVGCHCLLQGIFPTQGSNPGLLHCRQTLYHLSQQGSLCVYFFEFSR